MPHSANAPIQKGLHRGLGKTVKMPNQMTNVPTAKQRALTMYHAGCRKLVMFTNSCGEAWMTAEGSAAP